MIDHVKLICHSQQIINRLRLHPKAKPYKHEFNTYEGFEIYGQLLRLDFRKSFERGQFIGYRHLELSISPHYHFNRYLHNGNDLTPKNAIKSIKEIFAILGIAADEAGDFIVVNLEYGLNVEPRTCTKEIINALAYYKKTPFIIPDNTLPYFKRTDSSKAKRIKAYAKGLQFSPFPEYGIPENVFRFEVKNKKSAPIRKLAIVTAKDLLKTEVYTTLGLTLAEEWNHVLTVSKWPLRTQYANTRTREDKNHLRAYSKIEYWQQLIASSDRNKFTKQKKLYYNLLQKNEGIHAEVTALIEAKLHAFGIGAFCPQKIKPNRTNAAATNTGRTQQQPIKKVVQIAPHTRVVKCESAPLQEQPRQCIVTGLDITMQKDESKFLFVVGLNHYRKTNSELYEEILRQYWSNECRDKTGDDLHRVIAHNIRNRYNNNRYRITKTVLAGQLNLF